MKILDVCGHRVNLNGHLSKIANKGYVGRELIGLNILKNRVIIDSVR
jgi:hypothetical protein